MGYNILMLTYSDVELDPPEWLQPMSESLSTKNSIDTIREQGEEQTILIMGKALKKNSHDLWDHINMENHQEAREKIQKKYRIN